MANAGLILLVAAFITSGGWGLSVLLYDWGLWPLGAALRILVWLYALASVYLIGKHLLLGSDAERLARELAGRR